MTFNNRFVALGDSFTEGMGDPEPLRPIEVRGWADRVAEALADHDPSWGYVNLAIRGKKLKQIIEEQFDVALSLKPTLISIYAGANDILRVKVDMDELISTYRQGLEKLTATGARVLVFTGFNPAASRVFGFTRYRVALYNEMIREMADACGAEIIDYWRMHEIAHPAMWCIDKMHMSTRGHTQMAANVLDYLKVPHQIDVGPVPEIPQLKFKEALDHNMSWVREYLFPWISRRVRRVSSGDNLTARYPEYVYPRELPVSSGIV